MDIYSPNFAKFVIRSLPVGQIELLLLAYQTNQLPDEISDEEIAAFDKYVHSKGFKL